MIALFLALSVQASQPEPTVDVEAPVGPLTTVTTQTKLHIPDEIAPAVFPYLSCMMGSRGMELRSGGVEVKSPVAKGGDCAPARIKAAKDADALLKRREVRPAAARSRMIDDTLASIDAFIPPLEADQRPE